MNTNDRIAHEQARMDYFAKKIQKSCNPSKVNSFCILISVEMKVVIFKGNIFDSPFPSYFAYVYLVIDPHDYCEGLDWIKCKLYDSLGHLDIAYAARMQQCRLLASLMTR